MSQLWKHGVACAVPMVGFGFMDNTIMIHSGEYIDNTVGVAFGLPTLTAAAMGQVMSDLGAVLFGGSVGALAARCGLPDPKLSDAQMRTRAVRWVSLGGAAVGVVCGCTLGMTSLLFLDLDRADREKRAKRLDAIFVTLMQNSLHVLSTERATLWLYDEHKQELWTRVSSSGSASGGGGGGGGPHTPDAQERKAAQDRREALKLIRLDVDETSIAGTCAVQRATLMVPHAYADPRFNPEVDRRTGMRTESILAAPILDKGGKLVGVLQCINKVKQAQAAAVDADRPFDDNDVRVAETLAMHISMFIECLE